MGSGLYTHIHTHAEREIELTGCNKYQENKDGQNMPPTEYIPHCNIFFHVLFSCVCVWGFSTFAIGVVGVGGWGQGLSS